MRSCILAILVFSNCYFTIAQPLLLNWQQCLGGTKDESCQSIYGTNYGLILMCNTDSDDGQVINNHGMGDFWLVKTDSTGSIFWSKTYGGSDSEYSSNGLTSNDGGFIMFGETYSNDGNVSGYHGGGDYWIVKVDSTGNILWSNCFGGSSREGANELAYSNDQGFILIGASFSIDGDVTGNHGAYDCWLVKLDQEGELQWEKALGGSGMDIGISIGSTDDGGYILGATTDSQDGDVQCLNHGFYDAWIIKINIWGNIEWQRCYGGSNGDGPNKIIQTSEGGYIFAGTTNSNDGDISGNHGENDIWVVKMDSLGFIEWNKCYGGSHDDIAYFIQENENGFYIVGGATYSNDGNVIGNHSNPTLCDSWVFKLSTSGNIIWQQCLGGDQNDNFHVVLIAPGGKFTFAGTSNTWDLSGDVLCTNHKPGKYDVWVAETLDSSYVGLQTIYHESKDVILFPNPANDIINFDLRAFVITNEVKVILFDLFIL